MMTAVIHVPRQIGQISHICLLENNSGEPPIGSAPITMTSDRSMQCHSLATINNNNRVDICTIGLLPCFCLLVGHVNKDCL